MTAPDGSGRGWSEAGAIEAMRGLIDAARFRPVELRDRLATLLDDGLNTSPDLLGRYGPVATWGQDFLFLHRSEHASALSIDNGEPQPMRHVPGTDYWHRLETLQLGTTHNFVMVQEGQVLGGMGGTMQRSVAGYNPDSYPIPGASRGTLSEMRKVHSRVYEGMTANYWIYSNPGIDTDRGAPLMIWLDGRNYIGAAGAFGLRLQTVTDNLVHRGLIPPMVHVLLHPGTGGSRVPETLLPGQTPEHALRSVQFDTVSDEFGQYLVDEVLPDVEQVVKLRQDSYSRAIAGESSGGIAAFKVCWFRPETFSRAYSSIGSFTALQWHPDRGLDGGNIFPLLVRRQPKRNIRVWLSDGIDDIDMDGDSNMMGVYHAGSWPLANIEMAQALKTRLYDFHFRYGTATHSTAQWALDLPESLAWLWRGYDPALTTETFEQEATERAKPLYRVKIANRDAW